ncbi:MAG: flagellar hook-basal body protein [Capsulimonadaceae bacterium]|nr:flagellar hook-basal body protein [Capsulimonadaceae bacterium]
MTRGVYIAATGMLAEEAAQQVIAQNLANASTTGYKEDIPVFRSFDENLVSFADSSGKMLDTLGSLGNGAAFDAAVTDFGQGGMQQTGNPLDIAMTGNAFIGIATANGTCYSRDGALTLSRAGVLVQAASGLPVLDDKGGQIQLSNKMTNVHIDADGVIKSDAGVAGRIGLFAISMAQRPRKIGGNLIQTTIAPPIVDATRDPGAGVRSGFLETSNVNIVREMVTMIAGLRAYEANQKTLQSHDSLEEKSVNTVGRVG